MDMTPQAWPDWYDGRHINEVLFCQQFLEKHPMKFLYGYDVIADLHPTRYDEVVTALGGAGETVTRPGDIGPALDRAFAAGLPYLVNVMTDTDIAYPRSTTGI